MDGDARDHERYARHLDRGRQLRQHHDPDHGRGGGQQRDHQRVGRPRDPRERELVGHVGDHRRRHADADPGGERDGIREGGQHGPAADRRDDHGGDQHRGGERVDAGAGPALGDTRAEDDVEREEHGVDGGEGHAQRLAGEHHVREQVDAGDGHHEGDEVARRPHPERRQHDHGQELDRGHGAQRQPVDRAVEHAVHHGQGRSPREQHAPAAHIQLAEGPPRPAPDGEDQGGRGDPQPGDAEHLDAREQEHGERGPQVVEDRADREEALRRRLGREHGGPAVEGGRALVARHPSEGRRAPAGRPSRCRMGPICGVTTMARWSSASCGPSSM